MKIILSLWRHHYMARVGIFLIMLIVVALIAGMVGCGQAEPKPQPQLECTPMVAAGGRHTVGLKSDGTVVALGWNGDGQCDVGNWTDIIQVAAGGWTFSDTAGGHTVGVKSDGTVVATGWEAELATWNLIEAAP
jgi:alpha-tubulin suppressor-like RCC1 family protein